MLITKQPPTMFGSRVADLHSNEMLQSALQKHDHSIGIAAVWVVFYAVIATAAVLHHFGHHHV